MTSRKASYMIFKVRAVTPTWDSRSSSYLAKRSPHIHSFNTMLKMLRLGKIRL